MSAGSEEKHGFGHVLPYLGKIQAVTRRCQQRLGRPYHFSTRSIPQNVIDALVRERLAVETGVVGFYKKIPCYTLTQAGENHAVR